MKKYINIIIGLLLSIFLLYLVFRKIDIKEVIKHITSAKLEFLLFCVVFGVFLLLLRSYRWRLFVRKHKELKLQNFFESTVLGLFFNVILPFRIGDLIQGFSLAKKTNLAKSLTFSSVLMERFIDLFPPIIFITVGSLFIVLPKEISVVFSIFVLLFLVLGLIFILKFKNFIVKIIENLSLKIKLFQRLNNIVQNFYLTVENFKDKFFLTKIILLTFFLWLGYSFIMWLTCFSLGIKLPSFYASLLVQAITSLSVAIPASPGYVGSWEFMGMLALSIFNVEKTKAVAFSILSHIISLLPIIILGLIFIVKETALINYLNNWKIKNEA